MADKNNDLKCHICGRAFRLRSSLKVHITEHKHFGIVEGKSAEGANSTDSFVQEELLQLTEKRDSPKECQYCGKQFTLPSSLNTHIIDCKDKLSRCHGTLEKKISSSEIGSEISVKEENIFSDVSESEILDTFNQVKNEEVNSVVIKEPHVVGLSSDMFETSAKKGNSENNELKSSKSKSTNDRPKVKNKNSRNNKSKADLLGSVDVGVISAEEGEKVGESESMFKCETCGKSFTKPGLLLRHVKYHSSKFICLTCDKVFLSQFALSQHVDSKTCSEEGKTCKYCSRKYTTKAILLRHIKRTHSGKFEKRQTAQCDICNKFVAKSNLEIHKRIHTGERPYQCEFCGASFVQSHHLQRHIEVHTKPAYQCKVCSVSYTQEETLRKHIMKFHDEKDVEECVAMQSRYGMKKCSKCDLQFSNQTLLGRHENTAHSHQHQPLDKKCSYCEKSFSSHALRRYHERLHTGEKPEVCPYCDKRFRLPQSLKVHIRTHTGDRPFRCKTCGKTFIQKQHLFSHRILHTGEKPYLCKHCGKMFANQSNLGAHEKKNCSQVKGV